MVRTIALEEHFATRRFIDGPGHDFLENVKAARAGSLAASAIAHLVDQLLDLDNIRIADMDAAGVDVQVISLGSPGVEQLDADAALALARQTNDCLAEAIKRHPKRFMGFAALPTASPNMAADELERTVRNYGFKGAAINGHVQGRYLDDAFFWPILERAEALEVPIYLHPTLPTQTIVQAYYTGNFSPEISAQFGGSSWGWHIETANHVLRIILSGVFDRYPRLQLVIGHLGETLAFMLPRLDKTLSVGLTKLKRPMGSYLRENLYYTFGGFNYLANFLQLLFQVGVERIMFSTDYPYRSMVEAKNFLEQLPLAPADINRIAHGNAERLLRL